MEKGLTIPKYKGGNKPKTNPDSYRAISLLPTMYKLFEKVVHDNILNELNVKNIGVGRFRILRGRRYRILGGPTGGGVANS